MDLTHKIRGFFLIELFKVGDLNAFSYPINFPFLKLIIGIFGHPGFEAHKFTTPIPFM